MASYRNLTTSYSVSTTKYQTKSSVHGGFICISIKTQTASLGRDKHRSIRKTTHRRPHRTKIGFPLADKQLIRPTSAPFMKGSSQLRTEDIRPCPVLQHLHNLPRLLFVRGRNHARLRFDDFPHSTRLVLCAVRLGCVADPVAGLDSNDIRCPATFRRR